LSVGVRRGNSGEIEETPQQKPQAKPPYGFETFGKIGIYFLILLTSPILRRIYRMIENLPR
jgi:hypothetical protein